MKILVFGAGAMGSVFGGFLSIENDVTLIGRGDHIKQISEYGLGISGIWGDHNFRGLRVFTSIQELDEKAVFDLIMITTKAYSTRNAVELIKPFVTENTAVMSMQNGIGNEDIIKNNLGIDKTMGGMAIFGARVKSPGNVEVTVYASECLVGDLKGGRTNRAREISEIFTRAGIPTNASDDIIRDKWMKTFYNVALNPLSAILKVPYGDLGKMESTRDLMKEMLKEGFKVANFQGIPLKKGWEEYYNFLLEEQLPPTSEHRSSMLQDIERGKPTEIDYLNGAIVRIGDEVGINTPVNKTIMLLIKSLENLRGAGER